MAGRDPDWCPGGGTACSSPTCHFLCPSQVSSTGHLPLMRDRKAAPREMGKARDKLSIPQGGGV